MPRKDEPSGEGSAFEDLDKAIEGADAPDLEGAAEERLHPILSNEQVRAAQAKARARLEKERETKAMKAVEEAEVERLRLEEGLTTGDGVRDEVVDIVIDLAPHSDRLAINGQAYHHSFTYTVPRHVGDYLREQMWRGWQHQDEIDGKNKMQQHQANRQFAMLKKGAAGGAKMSLATGAVAGALPKNLGLRPGPEDHAHG